MAFDRPAPSFEADKPAFSSDVPSDLFRLRLGSETLDLVDVNNRIRDHLTLAAGVCLARELYGAAAACLVVQHGLITGRNPGEGL